MTCVLDWIIIRRVFIRARQQFSVEFDDVNILAIEVNSNI